MLIPVGSVDPFRGIKGVSRVRRLGKAPWFVDVPAESDYDDPFAMLRNPKVGGVYFLKHDPISKTNSTPPV